MHAGRPAEPQRISLVAKLPFAIAIALVFNALASQAASLQVQPAMLDIPAPGAASTITLRNAGTAPINVQVRIFKWSQSDGEERLESTEDVAASPPAVTLAPGTDYVARIVRVVKRPIIGEETYRLLVDELPISAEAKSNSVRLLIRHSIPVFFTASDRSPPAIDWGVSRRSDRIILSARNAGDSHLRISAVTLRDRAGRTVSFGSGLMGYSLGHSTMLWAAPGRIRGFAESGSITISGQGNDGPFRASTAIGSTP
jgi:fimbrial chaperone protein